MDEGSSTAESTTTQAEDESSTPALASTSTTDPCPGPESCETGNASFSSGPAPTCDDGIHIGPETDIDCGGDCPNPCALGQGCDSNDDCDTSACDPDTLECVAPTACGNSGNWRHLLPDEHQRASPQEHYVGPPAVAIDADGRYTVAWTSGSKTGFGVYLQQYEPTGDALGAMLQVSEPSHFVTQTPVIAANATGELVAAYLGSDSNASGPFVRKFDSSGRPLGTPTLASPPEHYLGSLSPAVDISDDGSFVVGWTPEQSAPPSVWVQAFAPDGSPTGAPIQASPAEHVVIVRPNVATDAQGNFIAAWTAEDDPVCYARRFNQDTTPLEDAWPVSPPGESTTSPCDVDMASDGRFAVTWVSNDSDDGFLHSYDTSGQLLGAAQVNQHGPVYVDHPRERHAPPVSVGINADGNIAVAYTIDRLLTGWVRTFDATAEPLMDEQVIAGNHLLLTTPQLATSSCSDSLAVSWLRDDSGAARSRVYRADNDDDGTADLCCG